MRVGAGAGASAGARKEEVKAVSETG